MSDRFFNLFIPLKELKEIMDDAYVVIDTNVLLMAYQWRDTTYKVVFDILSEISKKDRLKIPHQVVKEFANNRAEVIQTLHQDIHDKLLSKLEKEKQPQNTIKTVVPAYDMFDETVFKPILDTEERYLNAIKELNIAKKEYKLSLVNDLQAIVKGLLYKDPISAKFKNFFDKGYINEIDIDSAELTKELERRKKNNIPPGYKDKGHKGDYLIWQSILSLKDKSVIFVTGDVKADWAYTRDEDFLGGRRELIEEFYEKNKQTLHIITPLEFAEVYSSNLNEEVKEDLKYKLSEPEWSEVFNEEVISAYKKKKEFKYRDYLRINDLNRRAIENILTDSEKPENLSTIIHNLKNDIEHSYIHGRMHYEEYMRLKHAIDILYDEFHSGNINYYDTRYRIDEIKEGLYIAQN